MTGEKENPYAEVNAVRVRWAAPAISVNKKKYERA